MFNKHERTMMETAILFSKSSTCKKRQVGCVIDIGDSRQLITGYNGMLPGDTNNCEEVVKVCSKCDKVVDNNYSIGESHCSDGYIEEKLITKDNVIHAEQNAIMYAVKNGISINNKVMYVTCMPCIKCANEIILSGIKKVIYKDDYKNSDGLILL